MTILRFVAVLFVCLVAAVQPSPALEKPNIVVILADDFGVGDIQAHYPENKIRTPALDKLVREGTSFTDAHSPSAVCSPTRYGLLTGRYCWRTRMQEWVIAAYEPPLISPDRPTLPGFLKANGYYTSCIGKWHLGWDWSGPQKPTMAPLKRNVQKHLEWDFSQRIAGGPIDRGFNYYFGVVLPNMPPFCWIENDRVTVQPTAKYRYSPEQGHVMPRGFEGCPMAPGWQFDEILPELTRRGVKQIHQLARSKQPFFLYFSMTSPHEPIVPSRRFKGKSGIAPIADFVMETDWSAGQIIAAIDEAGIADNTIVVFTADNGHSHYTGWEKLIEAGHQPSGPFRGHKGDVWEGGHRVPMIVRWPDRVPAGAASSQMVSLTDLFATCAELMGQPLPPHAAPDSFSFLSAALQTGDGSMPRRTTLVNHSNFGEFAYRNEHWKLVYRLGEKNLNLSRGKPTIAELYNLKDDVAEAKNLATVSPQTVQQLTAELTEVISSGASRPAAEGLNDTRVRFDMTQEFRWVTDDGEQP